jgi:uncharacterized membrane protein YgcG
MRLAILGLLTALVAAPAAAEERITSFDDTVTVRPDASIEVVEEIAVAVEGAQIHHGILRDFPTTYTDRLGRRVRVGFEVRAVERDGRPEPYKLEPLSNGTRVRIGAPDVTVPNGPHRYRLAYRATRQLGFFDGFDELYWNVTGNGWTFPIVTATATIQLPDGVPVLQRAFYTGAQGQRDREARVVDERPGRIVFRTTRPLQPGEGLTVAVAWPKGHVRPPSDAQRWAWFAADNGALLLAGGGSVAILAYYLLAWLWVGRDPARGTVIPLFTPPDGLSAPALRYATEMTLDDKGFAAGILSLAVKRRLRIVDRKKGYRLERLSGEGPPLSTAELSLEGRLFAGDDALDLEQANHERVSGARKALLHALALEVGGSVFRVNTPWFAAGAGLSVLVLVGTLFLLRDEIGDQNIVGFGLFAGGAAGALFALLLDGARGWWRGPGWRSLGNLLVRLVLFGTVVGFVGLLLAVTGSWPILAVAALAILLAGLAYAFFHLLKAPTPSGRQLLDRIEGFKRYLEVAEEDRLGVLHPPERTPELFERYLPYALALGVEHAWSRKFADVLARSAVDGTRNPDWYSGDRWDADHPSRFADHVGGSLATAAASASSAPGSSSGSGGGGSSGGGGGGGGGSGW